APRRPSAAGVRHGRAAATRSSAPAPRPRGRRRPSRRRRSNRKRAGDGSRQAACGRKEGTGEAADLEDPTGLLEGGAGRPREQACRIAVAEIAEEVGAPTGAGEELAVDTGIVEAGHRPAVEA